MSTTYRGRDRVTHRRHVAHPEDLDAGRPAWYIEATATDGADRTARTICIDVDGAPCAFPAAMATDIILAIEASAEWLHEHHPLRPAGELPERAG